MVAPATTGSLIHRYLDTTERADMQPGALAYYAALDQIATVAPAVAASIVRELRDQRTNLKLIASENYASLAVQLAQGNLLTDKYAEGYPGHRFYAGCDNVDDIEAEGARLACELFGSDHAYLQPHSGADANLVAFLAVLAKTVEEPELERLGKTNPNELGRDDWNLLRAKLSEQRMLALDYYSGGHLTHGYRFNISARMFDAYSYTVDRESGLIDLDALRAQVREVKPRILLAGYSAYPRAINFAEMRAIADEAGAVFMVDMAHFAGLVAGKVFAGDYNPVAHAHIVTTTTHKTLRGPRGGMVLASSDFAEAVDKGCPAVLGGPLPHAIAAKTVALREAAQPEFAAYAQRIVDNARALAEGLVAEGVRVLTGGTDNHLVLVDVNGSFGLNGRQAEAAVRECGLTLNRNAIPFDPNGPWYTSGLRLGTPGLTTLGMGPTEMREVAAILKRILSSTSPTMLKSGQKSQVRYNLDSSVATEARSRVQSILSGYPLYPELDLELLLSAPFMT